MPGMLKKSFLSSKNRRYYPVFLNLSGQSCLIVGGGAVAERKCRSLINHGAAVTIISPSVTKKLAAAGEKGLIRLLLRSYRRGDCRHHGLIIAATNDASVNSRVSAEAIRTGKLINVVDHPSSCNFIVPSIMERGPLTVAVSTGGVSPALARTIRMECEALYRSDFIRYLNFLKNIRLKAMQQIPDQRKRECFLKEVAGPRIISLVRKRGFPPAKIAINKLWKTYVQR